VAVFVLSLGTEQIGGGAPEIAWTGETGTAEVSMAISEYAHLQGVSSSGTHFLLREEGAMPGTSMLMPRWTAGSFRGDSRSFPALAAALASDDHLLVLEGGAGDSLELRMEPIAGGGPVWRRILPSLLHPRLVAGSDGAWSVVGTQVVERGPVMLSARGAGPVRTLRGRLDVPMAWPLGAGDGAALLALRPGAHRGASLPLVRVLGGGSARWDVWLHAPAGEWKVAAMKGFPSCAQPRDAAGWVACSETQGQRSVLWSYTPLGVRRRIGTVPQDAIGWTGGAGRLAAVRSGNEVVLVDPARRRGRRLLLPGAEYAQDATPVDGGLVVVHQGPYGTQLTRYRLRP
jgi:hypothetical protein